MFITQINIDQRDWNQKNRLFKVIYELLRWKPKFMGVKESERIESHR